MNIEEDIESEVSQINSNFSANLPSIPKLIENVEE